MAGGIDWFRWHHGSVTDPKFQLVARKSKQSLATIIAVWAFVLEKASASEDRGHFGGLDCESVDCMFGLEDGATQAILSAMADRGLVDADRVASWGKRQVKRERTDDFSTDRVKAFRSKERQETPKTNDETPCNATQHQKKPRGEESREEKKNTPSIPQGGGFDEFWSAYPKKVGKDDARKAFLKRKPDGELLALMLAAIAAQRESQAWIRDGGQYIPNPSTWLNQGRWQDETDPVQQNGEHSSLGMFV